MNGSTFLYLACILAGFALVKAPLTGVFQPLQPLAFLIGGIAILLFSCVLLFNGLMALLGRGTKL